MAETHVFLKKEEIANAITHGIGIIFSIVALVLLIVTAAQNGTAATVVAFSVYGGTMVLLYTFSTLLHSFPEGKVKDLFEIFDHSGIYLFIAGSYTPLALLIVQGARGWTLFGIVWGIALFGIIFKAFWVKKFLFLSTALYIAMGWLIVFAWEPLITNLVFNGVILLVVGGLLYTIGSIFYVWRGFRFHHAVWHLFVLAGSVTHFLAIILYVV
ncbi:hemolysin III family protein [Bacillus aquiflavi]|uniref:PAQR family membrane homeostasis protein TrhA n=1 Tax=Bacillus aquiflavi TaxID=2672567 RepID=UPI001CA9382E|nr:hemolysin III family protein [Bacillus aquiflavi]UAC50147.1 hemolysin III family protein [Bacillus aquiflavi]